MYVGVSERSYKMKAWTAATKPNKVPDTLKALIAPLEPVGLRAVMEEGGVTVTTVPVAVVGVTVMPVIVVGRIGVPVAEVVVLILNALDWAKIPGELVLSVVFSAYALTWRSLSRGQPPEGGSRVAVLSAVFTEASKTSLRE